MAWEGEAPIEDKSSVGWEGEAPTSNKSFGGLMLNAAKEVPELVKGAWDAAKFASGIVAGTPQARQQALDLVQGLPSSIADTAINVRNAIRERGLVGAATDYAYDKPLTTAMTLWPGVGMAGKGAKAVGLVKTGEVLEGIGSMGLQNKVRNVGVPTPKTAQQLDMQINRIIDKGISTGIRPSVEGKRTFVQASKYNDRAREAVKTIVSNKGNLKLVDETGQLSAKLPESLQQFSQAVDQTKRAIFQSYDEITNATGKMGAKADLNPITAELKHIVDDEVVNTVKPEIAEYARKKMDAFSKQGEFTPVQAQDAISHLNQSLEAFYKNPSYENASKASIDSMIANRLRKQLDDAVEAMDGAGYQELKNKYGSLKAIERDVNRRAIVDARKNMKGLIDFSDIFSGSEVVRGILTMNPSTIATGVTAKSIAAIYKHMNNPNRIIKNMFENTDKIMTKANMGATTRRVPVQRALMAGNPEAGSLNNVSIPLKERMNVRGTETGNIGVPYRGNESFDYQLALNPAKGIEGIPIETRSIPNLINETGNIGVPYGRVYGELVPTGKGVKSIYPPPETDYIVRPERLSIANRRIEPAQGIRKPRLTKEQLRKSKKSLYDYK